MTNDELEKKISAAFSNAVPDVFDRVMDDIDMKQGRKNVEQDGVSHEERISSKGIEDGGESVTFAKKNQSGKGRLIKGLFGAAAAAAVVVGTVFGIGAYNSVNAVASVVSLDVNPGIEIDVNKDRKVLRVLPKTDDAVEVIGTMDFKGAELDVTVNALLGSMISKGYISELANSILVSVDNADPETASSLQSVLMEEIDAMIGKETFSGAVVGQVIQSDDKELRESAEQYGITLSKAQMIKQITSADPTLKFEDLVSLNINDLNLLKKGETAGLSSIGAASDKSYIGADRAVSISLEDAGFSRDDTNFLRIAMDYENERICYNVSFHKFENKLEYDYNYDIDAVNGEIISSEKELGNLSDLSDQDITKNEISEDEAREMALALAGVDPLTIYEYELERDYDRVAHYDIEFKTGGYEYNYSLTMFDGTIIKDKWELEPDYYPGVEKLPPISDEEKKDFISEQRAKEIALEHAEVNEAATYDVEIELERERGKIIYEVEFKSGRYSYSYDLEPETGEVIDYELNYKQ